MYDGQIHMSKHLPVVQSLCLGWILSDETGGEFIHRSLSRKLSADEELCKKILNLLDAEMVKEDLL